MVIAEKLLKIQSELKAPKSQYNSFGKYKYRNCEDILESVKPLLLKNNCILNISDSIELIGNRFYVKATAYLICCETNEKIESSAYSREEETKKGMDAMQLTGATSSYARKYALNGLFCIDDTKDSDTTNNHDKELKENKKNVSESNWTDNDKKIAKEIQKRLLEIAKNDQTRYKQLILDFTNKYCDTLTKLDSEQLQKLNKKVIEKYSEWKEIAK